MNQGILFTVICMAAMALVEVYALKANMEKEHETYEFGTGKNSVIVTILSFIAMFALFAATYLAEG